MVLSSRRPYAVYVLWLSIEATNENKIMENLHIATKRNDKTMVLKLTFNFPAIKSVNLLYFPRVLAFLTFLLGSFLIRPSTKHHYGCATLEIHFEIIFEHNISSERPLFVREMREK